MAANSILAKMAVQIIANNAEFARAMKKSQADLSSFTSGVAKMAGALGVAFSIQQVASFALEVSKLAGEAQAVRAAFERLPESVKLMHDLKEATGGTVSELDLMKRAVQASNFGISLQALPKLLEFATLRAQQTGQSVDYLVDSIVTGIGRKSKLILDNLGISAIQLNEALGDTAIGAASIGDVAEAVGKIAEENLKNMEKFSENASTKLQRLSAEWVNLKVALGDAANATGLLGSGLDMITGAMRVISTSDLTKFEKVVTILATLSGNVFAISGSLSEANKRELARIQEETERAARSQAKVIKEVDRAWEQFKGNIDEFAKAISPDHPLRGRFLEEFQRRMVKATDEQVTTLGELRSIEKELLATREEISETDIKSLEANAAQVRAIRERIKAVDDLLTKQKEAAAYTLSQTSQRAIAGGGVSGVTTAAGIGTLIPVDVDAAFQKMEALRNKSAEVTTDISEDFIDMSGIVAGSLANFAQGLGSAIAGAENFGDVILHTLGGFMQSFGASLIALGIGKIALEKFSGPAMIAAGFALTAAGAALSASISPPNLSGGGGGGGSSRGISRFTANTSTQNSSPQLVAVLKGEDIWITLQNYQSGKRFTGG